MNKALIVDRSLAQQSLTASRFLKITQRYMKIKCDILFESIENYEDFHKVYNEIQFKEFIILQYQLISSQLFIFLYYLFKGIFFYTLYGMEGFIDKFKIRKIKAGDLIYDSYIRSDLRFKNPNFYSLNFFYLILKFLIIYSKVINLFKTNNYNFVVVSSTAYTSAHAIVARVAEKLEKRIVLAGFDCKVRVLLSHNSVYKHRNHVSFEDLSIFEQSRIIGLENWLTHRLKGDIKNIDVINANKVFHKNFEEIYNSHITQNKIKVLYAPHAFSDANHQHGSLLYRDYFELFRKTIDTMAKNQKVIWFIKEHPNAEWYGEIGIIKEYLNNYPEANFELLENGMPTLKILNFFDLVVTARGNIGLEAMSLGIPTLIAGDSIYSDFNLATYPKTKEDYEEFLLNLSNVNRLEKSASKVAQKILWISNFWSDHVSGPIPFDPLIPGKNSAYYQKKNTAIIKQYNLFLQSQERVKDEQELSLIRECELLLYKLNQENTD